MAQDPAPDDKKVHAALSRAVAQLESAVHEQEAGVTRILGLVEQLYVFLPHAHSRLKLDAIIEACAFQDLTGQRIRKVGRLIQYLRDHKVVSADELPPEARKNAPTLQGDGGLSQEQIDKLIAGKHVDLTRK